MPCVRARTSFAADRILLEHSCTMGLRAYGMLCLKVERTLRGRGAAAFAHLQPNDLRRLYAGLADLRRHLELASSVPPVGAVMAPAFAEFDEGLPALIGSLRSGQALPAERIRSVLTLSVKLLDAARAAVDAYVACGRAALTGVAPAGFQSPSNDAPRFPDPAASAGDA